MNSFKRWNHRSRAALVLAAVGLHTMWFSADAQEFPSNPIRIFVPTAPATPPDIISRVIATELASAEKWKVVVEDRPGAVQTIAGSEVLKQSANGTSIYAMSVPVTAAPAFLPNMPFDVSKDFAPVIKISTSYNVLVVHPSLPAHSVSELVELLKRQPDKLTFSSGEFGSPAHLIGEIFKLRMGVRATHVPYQQFPQAIGDLVSGTNQYMFVTSLPVIDLIKAGKLRALAVTTAMPCASLLKRKPDHEPDNAPATDGHHSRQRAVQRAAAAMAERFSGRHARPRRHDAAVAGADQCDAGSRRRWR